MTTVTGTSRATSPVDVARAIVVCGVGRSGTSLLHSMLNAHPSLAFPPETHFFRRYVAADGARRRIAAGTVHAFAHELSGDEDFARAGVPPGEVLADEADGAIDTARVYGRVLERIARAAGKPRVGDKDPRCIDFIPALAEALPTARVVHVVRDPRAVVLSRTKAAWSASRPWWAHALLAQEQLRRGRREGRALFGEGYLEVRYERLLADPEGELTRICDHCGVEYRAEMLDFGASARALVGEREMSWKRETLGPLLTGNDEKWRAQLPAEQVAFVEAVCVEAFDGVGYPRSARRGALRRAASVPLRGVARSLVRARRWRDAL
ncbi:MAG: sulfotransferase [Planctomycetota bacterium]